MPDLVSIANDLKSAPDQWLLREAQQPSGATPPFLILSELQRRQLLRSGGGKPAPASSVTQDTVAQTLRQIAPPTPEPGTAPPPPGMTPVAKGQPSGTPGAPMPGAQPPQNLRPPMAMQAGGEVDEYEPYDPYGEEEEDDEEDGGYPMPLVPDPVPAQGSASRSAGNYDAIVRNAASRYQLPENFIRGVIHQESRGNPRAIGPKTRYGRAMGIMQMLPSTARQLGESNPQALLNPQTGIDLGARYLRQMYDRYGGNLPLTLAAYNAGPGNVDKYGKKVPPFPQTRNYVRDITGWMKQNPAQLRFETDTSAGEGPAMPGARFATDWTQDPDAAREEANAANTASSGLGSVAPFDMNAIISGATPAPPLTTLGSATVTNQWPLWKPPEPADVTGARTRLSTAQEGLKALTEGHTPYDPMSALAEDNIAQTRAAVEAVLGKRPDYGQLESAITKLQDDAQKSMHPSISNTMMHLGFGLLASHSPYFGQAMGEAGLGTVSALEKQQQTARENYIEALKAGVNLQDKKNSYDEKVAQLNFAQVRQQQAAGLAGEKDYQRRVVDAQKGVVKAQADLDKAQGAFEKLTMPTRDEQLRAEGELAKRGIARDPNLSPVDQLRRDTGSAAGVTPGGAKTTADKFDQRLAEYNKGRELNGLPPIGKDNFSQLPQADQDYLRYGTKPPAHKPSIFDQPPPATGVPGVTAAPATPAVTTPTPAPAVPPQAPPSAMVDGINLTPRGGFNTKVIENLPPMAQTLVQGIATYSLKPPEGKLASDPDWMRGLLLAKQYDPSFDANRYKLRYDTMQDFTKGKSADNLQALGQVVHHAEQLHQSWKDLHNWGGWVGGAANTPVNVLKGLAHRPDINAFELERKAVSDELMKYFRGAGAASEKEAKDWLNRLSPDAPPETQDRVMKSLYKLVEGRLKVVKDRFENAMDRPADFSGRFNQETRDILAKYGVNIGLQPTRPVAGRAAPQGDGKSFSMTATGPNGHRIGSNDGKTWFDLQTGQKVQ